MNIHRPWRQRLRSFPQTPDARRASRILSSRALIGAPGIAAIPRSGRPSALGLSEFDRLRAPRAHGLNHGARLILNVLGEWPPVALLPVDLPRPVGVAAVVVAHLARADPIPAVDAHGATIPGGSATDHLGVGTVGRCDHLARCGARQ